MRSLGDRGERQAVRFLKEQGYIIIKRNYKCPPGEVDIIARDGETLVFVEVKTRSGTGFGLPQEAVDRRKQKRLVNIAYHYIGRFAEPPPVRFDIVAVMKGEDGGFRLEHFPDAFSKVDAF
jgi:putative endonuclease